VPFPNLRVAWKLNENHKLSLFFNRRVDRPNEGDIRIFPKYDDAEIIKVGNPALRPQFTQTVELGYKASKGNGYLYGAFYHRAADNTITRISSSIPGSTLIYAIFQNVNRSYNTGLEFVASQELEKWLTCNVNLNVYRNQINAFTVENLYPTPNTFSAEKQQLVSGNLKVNSGFHLPHHWELQLTAICLAPDIIPQGKVEGRFSLDGGAKKTVHNGKGEWFLNATDMLNTMVIRKQLTGDGFSYTSADYYETQVFRIGYNQKF
jgi:hypothetical protein